MAIESKFSSKGAFNRLRIDIEGVSNKELRKVLDDFGKKTVDASKRAMIRLDRVATQSLINSVKFEINKISDSRKDTSQKGFMFILSANAEGTGGVENDEPSGKRFRYGNTIEHGQKHKMFVPVTKEIEDWINAKRVPIRTPDRKYRKKRKWKNRRRPDPNQAANLKSRVARTIAVHIMKHGFNDDSAERFGIMQSTVDMYFDELRANVLRIYNKSIKGFISQGLNLDRKK